MKKYLILLSLLTLSSCVLTDSSSISNETTNDSSTIQDSEHSSSLDNENSNNEKLEYLRSVFGDEIVFYSNGDDNPYGIDLNDYGSNVEVVFYDDKISSSMDPYSNVNKDNFYENYTKASSYEDSYFRSKHGLMSGDITPSNYLPVSLEIKQDNKYVRYSNATYVLSTTGEYIAYLENNFNEYNLIYYNGGYTSLNEVAAYLLAFGDVPANSQYSKNSSGKKQAISTWGEYGRINNTTFSGDTSKYPYEPELPTIKINTFHETDFGTTGNYSTGTYEQTIYNDGSYITRGAARMVFTCDSDVKRIDDRYVFYTYNHYNDFQEYLNYHNGWGLRFGNESAGNAYCYNSSDYYSTNEYPVTKYPTTVTDIFVKE